MANPTANVQLNITGNAQQQLQKIQKSVKGVEDSFGKLRNVLGTLAIGSFVTNMLRSADAIDDLSKATGISIAVIDGFGAALARSGGDAEDAGNLLSKLSVSLEELKEGSLKSEYTLDKLGISIQELRSLSDEDALRKIISSLAKMPAGAERTALAMQLLGKNAKGIDWTNLNGSLETFIQKAQKAEPGTKALAQLYDNLQGISKGFATQLTIGGTSLAETLAQLTNNVDAISKALANLTYILGGLGIAFAFIFKLPKQIKNVNEAIIGLLKGGNTLSKIFKNIADNFGGIFRNLAAIIGVNKLFGQVANTSKGLLAIWNLLQNVLKIGFKVGGLLTILSLITSLASNFKILRDAVTIFLAGWKLIGQEVGAVLQAVFKPFAPIIERVAFVLQNVFSIAVDVVTQKLKLLRDYWNETVAMAEEVLNGPKGISTPLVITEQGAGAAQAMPKDYFKGSSQTEFDRLKKGIQDTTQAFVDQKNAQLTLLKVQASYNLMSDRARAIVEAQRGIYDDFNNQIEDYRNKISQLTPEQQKLEPVYRAQIALLKSLRDEQIKQATSAINLTYDQIDAQQDLLAATQRTFEAYRAENSLADLEAELDLIGLQGDELERQERFLRTQQEMRDNVLSTVEKLIMLEQQYGNNKDANYEREKSQLESQLENYRKIAEGKLAIDEEYFKRKKKAEEDAAQGAADAIDQISKAFTPYQMAQDAVLMTWNKISSAVDEFVQTGKFKFSDFAKSVLRDLAAMIIKAQILFAIKKTLGFFGLTIPGLAEGGPAVAGKPYIVGEKGPELFVPKSSGTVVPNDQLTSRGTATGQVNAPVTNNYITNNINALDAKSVAQLFAENRKTLLGVTETARREMAYGM